MPVEAHDDETPETSVASVVAKRGRGRPKSPGQKPANDRGDGDDLAEERAVVAARIAPSDTERLKELERICGEIFERVDEMADALDDDRKARAMMKDGDLGELKAAILEMLAAVRHGNSLTVEFASSFRHLSNIFAWGGQLSHGRFSLVLKALDKFAEKNLAAQKRADAKPMTWPQLAWHWTCRVGIAGLALYGSWNCLRELAGW
jgi:hypothetical protein